MGRIYVQENSSSYASDVKSIDETQECQVQLAGQWFSAMWNPDYDATISDVSHKFCTIVYSDRAVEHNLLSVNILVPEERFRIADLERVMDDLFSEIEPPCSANSPKPAPMRKHGRKLSVVSVATSDIVDASETDSMMHTPPVKVTHKRRDSIHERRKSWGGISGMFDKDDFKVKAPAQFSRPPSTRTREPSFGGVDELLKVPKNKSRAPSLFGAAALFLDDSDPTKKNSRMASFGGVAGLFLSADDSDIASLFSEDAKKSGGAKKTQAPSCGNVADLYAAAPPPKKSREGRKSFGGLEHLFDDISDRPLESKPTKRRDPSVDGVASLFFSQASESPEPKKGRMKSFGGVQMIFDSEEYKKSSKSKSRTKSFGIVSNMFDSDEESSENPEITPVTSKRKRDPSSGNVAAMFFEADESQSSENLSGHSSRMSYGGVQALFDSGNSSTEKPTRSVNPSFGGCAALFDDVSDVLFKPKKKRDPSLIDGVASLFT